MHTNSLRRSVGAFRPGFSENRVCFLDGQRRKDLLDEAEATGGKMNKGPEAVLEGQTQKLLAEIGNIKVGWDTWIANLFRSSKVIDRTAQEKIMAAAEKQIQSESNLAIGKISGFFNRGKRRLYLATRERIAEQIRQNLEQHLQAKQKEYSEREGKFARLAQRLSQSGPLQLTSDKERTKIAASLRRVGEQMKRTAVTTGELPKEWESARETEQIVKQQLLKFDILDPTKLDAYLDLHAQGQSQLLDLVRSSPELAKENELRKCLLTALQELQRGNTRYYRLQKFAQKDPNVGTVQQRLAALSREPNILGRVMKLSLANQPTFEAYIAHRGDGYLVLQEADTRQYSILDLQTGELTYRDSGNVFHDEPLKETSFLLQ